MKGEVVIEANYNDAEIFSADGLAPVKDKDWGFINESGKLIVPTQYGISAGGLFSIFKNDDKGYISGLVRVKRDKEWAFLKTDGTVLGNQWFDNAENFQK